MKYQRQRFIKQVEGYKDQSGDDMLQPLLLVYPKKSKPAKLKPANGDKKIKGGKIATKILKGTWQDPQVSQKNVYA